VKHSAADMAVVVVTHNSSADLDACLASVVKECPAELIVVDNASEDDSVAIAESHDARVLQCGENTGFAAAVNAGVALGSAPQVFVLNPDAVVHPGALDVLARRLGTDPGVAAVGPRVENPDGTLQASCRRFPSVLTGALHGFLGLVWADNPVSRRYTMADWDHRSPRDVDWLSGCALALRRDAFDSVGGFDPAYFMYVEDVDLCWRLTQGGWRVLYDPEAVVTHEIGTSSAARPYWLILEHHRSMLRFERRRRCGRRGWTWPLVLAGVWGRCAATVVKRVLSGRRHGGPSRIGQHAVRVQRGDLT